MVKVLAFAGARDLVGPELEVKLTDADLAPACSAAQLMDRICALFPALAPHRKSLRMAINGVYAKDDELVRPGDEVALIPPVAGG